MQNEVRQSPQELPFKREEHTQQNSPVNNESRNATPSEQQRNESPDKELRARKLTVRFTQAEYEQLVDRAGQTTCNKISEFIRGVLLRHRLTLLTRDASLDDFTLELAAIRKELNAIGTNYNQVVKRLHMLSSAGAVEHWYKEQQAAKKQFDDTITLLFNKVEESYSRISGTYGRTHRK